MPKGNVGSNPTLGNMDKVLGKFWASEFKKVVYFPYAKKRGKYQCFLFIKTDIWSVEKESVSIDYFTGPQSMYSNLLNPRKGIKLIFKIA